MPVVHWPTFVQQLISREDERNRRWRAFVFSLCELLVALAFVPISLRSPS